MTPYDILAHATDTQAVIPAGPGPSSPPPPSAIGSSGGTNQNVYVVHADAGGDDLHIQLPNPSARVIEMPPGYEHRSSSTSAGGSTYGSVSASGVGGGGGGWEERRGGGGGDERRVVGGSGSREKRPRMDPRGINSGPGSEQRLPSPPPISPAMSEKYPR